MGDRGNGRGLEEGKIEADRCLGGEVVVAGVARGEGETQDSR